MTGQTISHFEVPRIVQKRPRPFECYTAETLWNDEHISARMLEASRKEYWEVDASLTFNF